MWLLCLLAGSFLNDSWKNCELRSELLQELEAESPQGVRDGQGDDRVDIGNDQKDKTDATGQQTGNNDTDYNEDMEEKNEDAVKEKIQYMPVEQGQETAPGFHRFGVVPVHNGSDEISQKQRNIPDNNHHGEKNEGHSHHGEYHRIVWTIALIEPIQCGVTENQKHDDQAEANEAETETPHEKRIAQASEIVPRFGDVRAVMDDIVEEHEFSS